MSSSPVPHRRESVALTVTAGNRLARWLHEEHARAAVARGESVWETPAILPWNAWLEKLWDEAIEAGALGRHPPVRLGDGQALALWESIIREWAGESTLLQPSATAPLAQEAWQRMHEWRVPEAHDGSDDARAFAGWAGKFRAACERHHWLDSARLMDALIPPARARQLALPASVILRGFDEYTPAQQALIDALREAGVTIDVEEGAGPPADARRVSLPTWRDEVEAAARFALARLQANPGARIGIVVPELARHRELIGRIFDDYLAPSARLPGGARNRRPYNMSLGRALADTSPVAEALAWLQESVRLHRSGTLRIGAVCAWLRSPCVDGAGTEWAARARLERYLRDGREPEASLRFLLQLARGERPGLEPCPRLAGNLNDWRQRLSHLPSRTAPSHWVPVLAELLAAAGWPGDRPRDSHEYQAMEHWRDLLGELRHYDAVTGAIGFEAVVARVQTLARAAIFQPQSPMVPVQILGLLETSGLRFDHLWVLGLQDENWPPAPRPHPFIPVSVQRRLGMPHATPERELVFARDRSARLMAAAPEVVFSSARMEGDRVLSPSPLLAELPERTLESLALGDPARHADFIRRQTQAEPWRDDRAPALDGTESGGGTYLFKLQSACPFRALAEVRLHAGSPPSDSIGLDALERGTLVHRALEKIWESLRDQPTLAGLGPAALGERIAQVVDEVIEHYARHRPFTWTARFRDLERERLAILLGEWLAMERERPPFEVLAREARRPLAVGPITVSASIDRIDRLADGALVVTDYKTGEPKTADWYGERPREPQLPLYALYGVGAPVTALVYAQVKRGKCQWRGIAAHDIALPGVETVEEADIGFADGIEARAARQGCRDSGFVSWDALRHHWQTVLERLAQSFRDGDAAVDPRDPDECKTCHLPSLCRIREREHRAGRLSVEDDEND